MNVDVWSDVMCPWCAVGRARLSSALVGFAAKGGGRESTELRWRSFELDPRAPRAVEGEYVERLAHRYGMSRAQAESMVDEMVARGSEEGIHFDFVTIRPGNTFDAHRLLHLAFVSGHQDALKDRLFRAYFGEGLAVGDLAVLQRLAVEVGLDSVVVAEVLGGDRYAKAVRGEQRLAQELGASAVPFFVFDQRVAVMGAQPTEVLEQALEQAWTSRELCMAEA